MVKMFLNGFKREWYNDGFGQEVGKQVDRNCWLSFVNSTLKFQVYPNVGMNEK